MLKNELVNSLDACDRGVRSFEWPFPFKLNFSETVYFVTMLYIDDLTYQKNRIISNAERSEQRLSIIGVFLLYSAIVSSSSAIYKLSIYYKHLIYMKTNNNLSFRYNTAENWNLFRFCRDILHMYYTISVIISVFS